MQLINSTGTQPFSFNKDYVCEEFYLQGYNAIWSVESQPTSQRNMSPPCSGSKNKPSKK
jgi:hypothetical protein